MIIANDEAQQMTKGTVCCCLIGSHGLFDLTLMTYGSNEHLVSIPIQTAIKILMISVHCPNEFLRRSRCTPMTNRQGNLTSEADESATIEVAMIKADDFL